MKLPQDEAIGKGSFSSAGYRRINAGILFSSENKSQAPSTKSQTQNSKSQIVFLNLKFWICLVLGIWDLL